MFSKSKDEPKQATNFERDRPVKAPTPNAAPSIIGSDVHIIGDLKTAGEIQLDSIVEGNLKCGALTMGEHGTVSGSIIADTVVIKGKVEGEIRARSVRLEKTAKVKGNVWHETLAVEAGAIIEGKFVHTENPNKGTTQKPSPPKRADDSPAATATTNGNGKSAEQAALTV